jgi:hypothetical protein
MLIRDANRQGMAWRQSEAVGLTNQLWSRPWEQLGTAVQYDKRWEAHACQTISVCCEGWTQAQATEHSDIKRAPPEVTLFAGANTRAPGMA